MRHAFIIQAHKDPNLLKQIVLRLAAPNHYFYINIDKKVKIEPFLNILKDVPHIRFLEEDNRMAVNWGGYSQIACTLKLLQEAIAPPQIDYVHSISGQDYPTKSNYEFDAFFESHPGESYMKYDSSKEHAEWSKTRGKYEQRYMLYHFNDVELTKVEKLAVKVLSLIEHFHYIRRPVANVYAGWSWFSWHRNVVEFVLKYAEQHPDFMKRFHNTSCCDEIIFHTMLHPYLEMLKIHSDNALRYIDWHPRKEYHGTLPKILDESDYEKLINSGALFCRKVNEEHSGRLLDMLDGKI